MRLSDRDLCFIDVETTGPGFTEHEIIDIAAIRTDPTGETVRDSWKRRLVPLHPERMTEYARQHTGYSETRWVDAVLPSSAIWRSFVDFVSGCVPVCHNPSFDRAFITLTAWQFGIVDLGLDYHWIGTESLGWPLYRSGRLERLSLKDLCGALRVEVEPEPYSAIEGAHACRRVYVALIKDLTRTP